MELFLQANRRINLPDDLTDLTWAPTIPPVSFPVLFLNSVQKFYWMSFWLTQNVIIERVCLGVCVCLCCDYVVMIFHRFGISAAFYVWCHTSTKGHRNVGGQMWYWHSNQVSGKSPHAHTHLFLSLFMWQAKAPAGGTHSTLYSLRTCDCGGRERRKGGERERGRGEKEAQVETLVFWDVQLSHKVQTEMKKSF